MAPTSFIPRARLAAGLCALTALFAVGCGDSKESSADTSAQASATSTTAGAAGTKECTVEGKKIQYVGPLKSNPVLQVMAAGFSEKADELGFDGEVMLTEDADPQRVLALGKQALAQGSDGMVLQAFDPSLYPLIKEATDQGIPVVVTHSPVPDGDKLGLSQTIRPDPERYGAEAAAAIGEQIGGRGVVAVTQGSLNPTENLAAESFKSAMAEQFPDVKVLESQIEGFEPAAAIARASSILQSDKDVVAAFSTTGGGVKTWSSAADESGRDVVIVGMDYTRPNLDLVRSGRAFAVVAQPIFDEHALAVEALRDVICGEQVEAEVLPESPIVTRDNVDDYYAILEKAGT
ncbi:sugar ABC transporter substrate-binding protein [Conexibacter stalactiti]|uniref:Sugar ABC transporter substrate-binding protein n=1 Tax=Conexibacter stalactiti TaxID=1940611 RepID=A0ABU4HUE2_9ACTN|nr:sugar ABC transporter substrate-binding protein [Conexibacter stalactiti]MDW5596931.1 sugar ABC transporter substrate-binding protein [Conexibacter stalactiti]MEC5037573.1 sugar ABC transporter substrate-binding protein [Conexibacter stalactiti]